MEENRHIGERIAVYRNKRGLSQAVLAGMVGRSVSWLSQLERGERSVDKLSVLLPMAKALRVDLAELVGEPVDFTRMAGPSLNAIDRIRAAMSYYLPDDDDHPLDLDVLHSIAVEIMTLYQAAQYDKAASLLPRTIREADQAVARSEDEDQRRAIAIQALTNQVASALFNRTGQTDLGWVAADRSINAGRQLDDTELVTAGIYRLGQVMLRAGRNEEALMLADSTLSTVDGTDRPSAMSLHGALLLTAAIAAARLDNRKEATRLIAQAQDIAERLGGDRNDHWTAFGPTNVRIHATSAAVSLGDPAEVIIQGETVDVGSLPDELKGRRSQVYIDMAWAHSQQQNDTAAVLSLLEAERLAPEAVRFNPQARDLIQTAIHRSRKSAVPGLDGLASRVGVVA
ncbi:MAG: helix-turn-helix transcriptional regulator [Actinomycetota bacterium]